MFADRHFHRTGRWHKPVPADATAPTITEGPTVSSITETGANVSWSLDEAGTGVVGYGTAAGGTRASDYTSQTAFEGNFLTAHVQAISSLTADTTYHYLVESADAAGNVVTSADDTFETLASGSTATTGYPTSTVGLTFVDWTGASLTEPARGSYVADPNFDGRIYRVSDAARAQYPRKPAWNADGSLLVLVRDGARLLDGSTYADLGAVTFGSWDVWDGTDPTFAWRTRTGNNTLYKNYVTGVGITAVRTFSSYSQVTHSAEGRPSVDGRYHFLEYNDRAGAFMYDAEADSILGSLTFPTSVDHVTTSPSGAYGLVRFANNGTSWGYGHWLISQSGQPIRNLYSGEHGDVVRDIDLRDTLVVRSSPWSKVDLETGTRTNLLGTTVTGGHCSGCAFDRPGWIYVSNHYESFGTPGWDEIAAVNLDGTGETQIFCQARTVQTDAQYRASGGYGMSTHAVVSPDGRKVTWGGAWERWTTGNSTPRGYVVEVPT